MLKEFLETLHADCDISPRLPIIVLSPPLNYLVITSLFLIHFTIHELLVLTKHDILLHDVPLYN